jgi:hypothetical protein
MDEGLGAPPTSLEAPPPPKGPPPPPPRSAGPGPEAKGGTTAISQESVNYTSAGERCESCEHFDEERMFCNRNKFDCEPDGHCDKFEILGSAAGAVDDTAMPFEEEGGGLPEEEEELPEEEY